jgi:hypothetical protein
MTKHAVPRVRPLASVVALCLVLLQLVSVLHFALVPHGFGAGLRGLVHLHRVLGVESKQVSWGRGTQQAPNRPTLVAGVVSCAPEACPLGFSGHTSTAVSPSQLSALIWLPQAGELVSLAHGVWGRSRVLLSAPKTSPPPTA